MQYDEIIILDFGGSDYMFNKKEMGRKISELRKKNNFSQTELGNKLGYQQSDISRIEKGTKDLTFPALVDIAKLFNVSADYLLGLTDAETNDKDMQFICDYTGLSADSIEQLRKYCIPDFSAIDALNRDKEDVLFDKQFEIESSQEDRKTINNFILSDTFDSVVTHGKQVNHINEAVMLYLAIYFGDYEYFFELKKEEKSVHNIQLFLNEYEHDYIHGAFSDRLDMFSFKLQKSILSYADELSIFSKFEDVYLEAVIDWIKFVVWASVQTVYEENSEIDKIRDHIVEFQHEDYIDKIPKLKSIYENWKSGDTNADNN